MPSDENRDLPTLVRWLDGIDDHPLRSYFRSRREGRYPGVTYAWWRNPILVPIDEALFLLESASPEGLGAKRREFRAHSGSGNRAMEEFSRLRSELIVGSVLAENGIPFRYNTKAGPDIVVQYRSADAFAIEVSSRNPSSVRDLKDRLYKALRERGLPASLQIRIEPIPPVAIRAEVRDAIVEQFAPQDGSPGVSSMRVMLSPALPEFGIPASWATIRASNSSGASGMIAPFNSPHMRRLAHLVARDVLREKRKVQQALFFPTILVVDLSNTDLPDVRYWSRSFEGMWQASDAYLSLGAMSAVNTRRIPEIKFSVNPYANLDEVKDASAKLACADVFASFTEEVTKYGRRRP